MVSFSCEGCGDVLTKKKLDTHRNTCRGATFTCLDCMTHFPGTEYRAHTSCMQQQKWKGSSVYPPPPPTPPGSKPVNVFDFLVDTEEAPEPLVAPNESRRSSLNLILPPFKSWHEMYCHHPDCAASPPVFVSPGEWS